MPRLVRLRGALRVVRARVFSWGASERENVPPSQVIRVTRDLVPVALIRALSRLHLFLLRLLRELEDLIREGGELVLSPELVEALVL